MIPSFARRWADTRLRAENEALRDRNRDYRLRLRRWDKALEAAERYFDAVNEPDDWAAFDPTYEARATGAAGYRARIRAAMKESK